MLVKSLIFITIAVAVLTTTAWAVEQQQEEEEKGFVLVPGGKLAPAECVHYLEADEVFDDRSGSIVSLKTGAILRRVPVCTRAAITTKRHGSAWRAWAEYDVASIGAKLGTFTTDFVVPPQPVSHVGQIVYLWPGIEPSDTSAVIQPVLQWGSTPAGGGSYWAVASWYVSSAHGWHVGNLVRCSAGDTIRGVMTRFSNSTWAIVGTVMSSQANATLMFKPVDSDSFTFLYEVLEAYNLKGSQCSGAYPADPCVFKNIAVLDANGRRIEPRWGAKTQDDSCGEHATIANGEVTIHYHK